MGDSYTFSLALVFNDCTKNVVCTIVCHSDEPIDKEHVLAAATEHLQFGLGNNKNPKELALFILNGIKSSCDVEAVLVPADAACIVGIKRNF